MASPEMLRRVALVSTDVSEELGSSFIRVTGIGELGTTLPPKRRILQELHGVTSQETPFAIVTAVKSSNLTKRLYLDDTHVDATFPCNRYVRMFHR
jgi:hypothetical protein